MESFQSKDFQLALCGGGFKPSPRKSERYLTNYVPADRIELTTPSCNAHNRYPDLDADDAMTNPLVCGSVNSREQSVEI